MKIQFNHLITEAQLFLSSQSPRQTANKQHGEENEELELFPPLTHTSSSYKCDSLCFTGLVPSHSDDTTGFISNIFLFLENLCLHVKRFLTHAHPHTQSLKVLLDK